MSPVRAALPCRQPGCPALLPKSGYCVVHAKQVDQARGNSTQRGYDGAWRKARLAYLAKHPICECADCRAAGRIVPSTVVDHIIPHRGDRALFWDRSNWQSMAAKCHNRKRQRESMEVR